MKKRLFALALSFALLLTGCATPTPPETDVNGTPWSEEWLTLGTVLGVEEIPDWNRQRNEDVLAAEGMYFASWTWGEAFLTEAGETAYPAQVFLVVSQCDSGAAAEKTAQEWQTLAQQTYQAESTFALHHSSGDFTLLPYRVTGENASFTRGMAAYGVRGNLAINLEFSCQEDVSLDPELTLTAFLDRFHFAK